jgi:hypothetical protein
MYGNKVMVVGFALSPLGLGLFFPVIIPAGAVVLVVGAVLVLLDK